MIKKKKSLSAFDVSGDDKPVKKKKKIAEDEPVKKKKKRPIEDEDDEPPKKKKKRSEDEELSESTALAVYSEDNLPKISKLKGKAKLRTIFGPNTEKILRLLEDDDTDPALALIYKRVLQTVVDVLPLAEMGIRSSKGVRGVHGFTMLISQLRELMVDVQSAQDRGMMGETLFANIVVPNASGLAQTVVQEYAMVAADLKSFLSPEDYEKAAGLLKDSRARLANAMTKDFRSIKEGIVNALQR